MNQTVLYIHGQGGNAGEAAHYAPLFEGDSVLGLDYCARTPWEAKEEFPALVDELCAPQTPVTLIANSIGAFFAMSALADRPIEKAFFISPIVDMEKLIMDMMTWAGVTEEDLRARGTIETPFGETLSWEYLTYVRSHPLRWEIPTEILYGTGDHLTAPATVSAFAERIGAGLTVMEGGEHWFHTDEQMCFLDTWIQSCKM